MRLIDGSFLEERCKRQMSDTWNKEATPYSWAYAYEQFLTDVENCATIDAVPVVRCADCKYLNEDLAVGGWDGSCRYWNTHSVLYSWFCSQGERKDGDGDG